MPEISRFYGMVITMYYNDHPPPHFHIRYGQDKAIIGIDPPELLDGKVPARALAFALEWATLYRNELLHDWELARQQQPLAKIAPLE